MGRNVVSASQPLAAQAGLRMLLAGGNAVDAAIAAAMALTVVEPTGCGLGSDGFAIVWDGKELHGLNASGRSPAAWTPEYFEKLGGIPETGWNAVTVPGAVSAWVALSKRLGKLPFAQLAQPAMDYARNGFPVSPTIARLWALGAAKLGTQPGFAECFMPNGRVPQAGEIFRSEAHARTLELIAETEGEAFYRGEVADLTALEAVKAPTDGDVYLVQSLRTFYSWDADGGEEETGAWIAGDTMDTVVGVQGHVLRGDRGDSLNRSLLGPGMIFARASGAEVPITLTTWTVS